MATPRFNRIALSFMAHINDVTTESVGVVQGGSIVTTTARIESYVNRALVKLTNQLWEACGYDAEKFLQVCPELATLGSLVKSTGDLTVPGDYFELVTASMPTLNGSSVNRYVRTPPRDKYHITKTGTNSKYVASSESPIIYEFNGTLYLFPTITDATIEILYIKMPVKSDGTALTSGGAVDSPFTDQWDEAIAEIAYGIYLSESDN
jgi:hypothetical protein